MHTLSVSGHLKGPSDDHFQVLSNSSILIDFNFIATLTVVKNQHLSYEITNSYNLTNVNCQTDHILRGNFQVHEEHLQPPPLR